MIGPSERWKLSSDSANLGVTALLSTSGAVNTLQSGSTNRRARVSYKMLCFTVKYASPADMLCSARYDWSLAIAAQHIAWQQYKRAGTLASFSFLIKRLFFLLTQLERTRATQSEMDAYHQGGFDDETMNGL